jgi:hypothetical protein
MHSRPPSTWRDEIRSSMDGRSLGRGRSLSGSVGARVSPAGSSHRASLNLNGRTNQFDLWDTAYDKIRPGDGLVAVLDDNPAGNALGAQVGTWFRE